MLSANKVPKKNLIQNFLSADWFADYSTGGGTMSVDPVNPHKMTFTMTASAQGRLIWIPVEIGKTYTFSFKQLTGLYRIYKRKVGNHDASMVLVQDQNAGKPDTFSFTVDDTYKGFITIRLTFGSAGVFTFENLQLEVGSKTSFEPYTLVNPNASVPPVAVTLPKTNILPIDSSSYVQGSINAVDGVALTNVARIRSANIIKVTSNQNYKIMFSPSYQAEIYLMSGNTYIGKPFAWGTNPISYTIPSNVDGLKIVFRHVTDKTIGASEIDLIKPILSDMKETVNPVATLYPIKNLLPPFSQWNKSDAYTINSDYKITGSFVSGTIKSCDYTVSVEVGKTYTLSGTVSPVSGRIRVGRKSDNGLIGVVGANGSEICTFKATENQYIISIDNNYGTPVFGGTVIFENIQLEEGSLKTPFEIKKLSNLRSV